MSRAFPLLFCGFVLSCAADPAPASLTGDPLEQLGMPGDLADRTCDVVLRQAWQNPDGSWGGELDVAESALAEDAVPQVLAHSEAEVAWQVRPVEQVAVRARPGFDTYRFTVPAGGAWAEAIPYLQLPYPERRFDHNRLPGELESYRLPVAESYAACAQARPWSQLRFAADFSEARLADPVAGGKLVIAYDLARLPECFGDWYMGQPTWNTMASVRFLPGGQLVSGPLRRGRSEDAQPLGVTVPQGATSAELWFSASGRSCGVHLDSDFGANYPVPVRADASRIVWAGDWGHGAGPGCARQDGLDEPHAAGDCTAIELDVYAPGRSDDGGALFAVVDHSFDDGPLLHAEPELVGRVGNNLRYRWTPTGSWHTARYSFRFSTDGVTWFTVATTDGPGGGAPRTLSR